MVTQSEYICFSPLSARLETYLTSLSISLLFCVRRNLKKRTLKNFLATYKCHVYVENDMQA